MSNPIRFGRVFLAALVAVALSVAPAERAHAQLMVGGGAVFTTLEGVDIGVQGNVYYGLPAIAGLRVGGDVTVYFPDAGSFMAINANGQYHVPLQPGTSLYGLAGLSISRASNGGSVSDESLNLGGGAEFSAGFGAIYGEVKLVTGLFDRVVFGGGVRIPLN